MPATDYHICPLNSRHVLPVLTGRLCSASDGLSRWTCSDLSSQPPTPSLSPCFPSQKQQCHLPTPQARNLLPVTPKCFLSHHIHSPPNPVHSPWRILSISTRPTLVPCPASQPASALAPVSLFRPATFGLELLLFRSGPSSGLPSHSVKPTALPVADKAQGGHLSCHLSTLAFPDPPSDTPLPPGLGPVLPSVGESFPRVSCAGLPFWSPSSLLKCHLPIVTLPED